MRVLTIKNKRLPTKKQYDLVEKTIATHLYIDKLSRQKGPAVDHALQAQRDAKELIPLPSNIQSLIEVIDEMEEPVVKTVATVDDDYQLHCSCWFKKHQQTYAIMILGFMTFTIFLLLGNLSGHRPQNHWRNVKATEVKDSLSKIKTNITL